MGLQRIEAALEVIDIFRAADKAQMRHCIEEVAWAAEAFTAGQVGPELLRDFELGIDGDGFLDVDRAVFAVRCVVQLTETGVTGAGIVPGIRAFNGPGFLQFDNLQPDVGIEFLEQYCQSRTHDAGSHQHQIHGFAIVLRH